MRARRDGEDRDVWPDPPYVGFVPLDDRMDRIHESRKAAKLMWAPIERSLQSVKQRYV